MTIVATTAKTAGKKASPPKRPARSIMAMLMGTPKKPAAVRSEFLIEAIGNGIPYAELLELKQLLGVPNETLARIAGVSKATLNRWKPDSRMAPETGDRVIRFGRLLGMAVQVMGNLELARAWFTAPQQGLAGATPLEFAMTEIGAREVEDLLGRIEHGVYS